MARSAILRPGFGIGLFLIIAAGPVEAVTVTESVNSTDQPLWSRIPKLSEAQAQSYLAYARTLLVSGNTDSAVPILKFLSRSPGASTIIVGQAVDLLSSLTQHDWITAPADATAMARIPRLTGQSATRYLDYARERIDAGRAMEAEPVLRLLAQSFGVPTDVRESALETYHREFELEPRSGASAVAEYSPGRSLPMRPDSSESAIDDQGTIDDDLDNNRSLTLGAYLSYDSYRTINNDLQDLSSTDSREYDQDLTLSAYMPFGTGSSAYGEITLSSSVETVDDELDGTIFVPFRGDTWLSHAFSDNSFIDDITVGRQYIGDARGWWWDDSLDLLLMNGSREPWSLTLGIGQELGSDEIGEPVDAFEKDILRLLAEAGMEWRDGHTLSLFLLRHDDRSSQPDIGTSVLEDESDPYDDRLLWIGARASGSGLVSRIGSINYWLDGAWVRGRDRLFDTESSDDVADDTRLVVTGIEDIDVNGWGLDAGLTLMTSLPARPQFTIGVATTSTDRNLDDSNDRTFRQSGLHGNSSQLGDSTWFPYYGIVLEPDLSNLRILTAAIGLPILQESVVVMVYHDYQQLTAADFLYSSSLDTSPLGESTDIGRSLGLIVPFNEWTPWDARLMLGAFEAGHAFGEQRGELSYKVGFHVGYEF